MSIPFTTPPPDIRDADAPFDDADADIILRSSDGVDFRVFKVILSLASPFFSSMFRLPQPTAGPGAGETRDGIPVIDMAESARTLNLVLRWCYPIASPELTDLNEICLVLKTASKYSIDALEESAGRDLLSAVDVDPLGVFAIATALRFPAIAGKAAARSLRVPLESLHSPYLHHITSSQYHELLEYRRACGVAARDVTLLRDWIHHHLDSFWELASDRGNMGLCQKCCLPEAGNEEDEWSRLYAPWFFWTYLQHAGTVLLHHPCGQAISSTILKTPMVFSCEHCHTDRTAELGVFSDMLADRVDRAVASVPMPSWC